MLIFKPLTITMLGYSSRKHQHSTPSSSKDMFTRIELHGWTFYALIQWSLANADFSS